VERPSGTDPHQSSGKVREAQPRPIAPSAENESPPPSSGTASSPPAASQRRRPPRGPRSAWGWFKQLLVTGLFLPIQLLTIGLLGAAVFVDATLPDLPDVGQGLRNVQLQEPLRVYSADGALIAEFGVERRTPVSYDRLPPLLINAFLATEDSRFFEHGGIDAVGMGRALLSYASTGIKAQGGSTITMQVTRNFFLSPEKTFQRKLAEVLLALHVEKTLTKEQILELYLNQIFFGHRSYGVVAAAANYYGKDLDQLRVEEMAMLAGLPKAPSSNNPIANPDRALERRNYILGRMRELGYIDQPQYEAAVRTPDTARLHRVEPELEASSIAEMARQEIVEHYGDAAAAQGLKVTTTIESWLQEAAQESVRKALRQYERRHGYRGPEAQVSLEGASEGDMDAYLEGVARISGLEPGLVTKAGTQEAQVYLGGGRSLTLGLPQVNWAREFRNANWKGPEPRRVSDVLSVGDLIRVRQDENGAWELSSIPAVTGALVALSPRDGAVRALVSGYSFNESKFNRALDMRRQPGSSFKPFVYAAALHEGWTPASLLKDQAIKLSLGGGKTWVPKNFDHKEMGPIRMRKALALSRNLASVNLLNSVGLEDAQAYIRRFGFEQDALPLGLSMALGTGETSPMKMAEAYAIFANGGYQVLPHFISRIEGADGQPIFVASPPRACATCWYRYGEGEPARTAGTVEEDQAEQVIDPRIAYQITSMLRDVIERGTGTRAKRLGRTDIAGKTGTTNDVRDSWFCGYQAELVAVAWMGFDAFHTLGRGEEGGRAALSLWTSFMEQALKDQPEARLEMPPGMVRVRIDGNRGTLTKAKDAMTEEVMEEYQLMLLGPEQQVATSDRPRGPTKPKPARSAPKVVDDLF
jgi:penicillin-binding protein 1A